MNKKIQNDFEQRLLNNASIDELIKMKMENELKEEFEKNNIKPQKQTLTDISKVPRDFVFSKFAVYKVFNRITGAKTFINGIQAESLLGLQNSVREKMKEGKLDVFATDNVYVKFEKIEL